MSAGTAVVANVTVVALGGRGILIEGPPGSGKSSLALALIDRGAMLVGDDGVTLDKEEAALIASPPPNIAGKIEIRGVGIAEMTTTSAPLALVLALDPDAPRYPLDPEKREYLGAALPCLRFAPGDALQAIRAEYALEIHGLAFPVTARKPKEKPHG